MSVPHSQVMIAISSGRLWGCLRVCRVLVGARHGERATHPRMLERLSGDRPPASTFV